MLADILEVIRCKEEPFEFAGKKLVIRELAVAKDLGLPVNSEEDLKRLEAEMVYRLVVRTVFFAEGENAGEPVFTDDDIEALQSGAKTALLPLLLAVKRVNGMDGDANAKK